MGEFIFEIILQLIFIYPGAAIRWTISRLWKSEKTFKEFVNDDYYMNGGIGLMTLGLIIGVIVNL